MTLVLVPATPTGLHPATVPALLRSRLEVRVVPVVDELDYYRELEQAWQDAEGDDLLVVEHDVEAGPEVVAGLLECKQPWCVAPYNSHEALGCAKFQPAPPRHSWPIYTGPAGPGATFDPGAGDWPLQEPVPWLQLDHALYRALMDNNGIGPHVHAQPRPIHHHGEG